MRDGVENHLRPNRPRRRVTVLSDLAVGSRLGLIGRPSCDAGLARVWICGCRIRDLLQCNQYRARK